MNVTVGEYTVTDQPHNVLRALRYGEDWRCCIGDNLVLALASEVEDLRKRAADDGNNTMNICEVLEEHGYFHSQNPEGIRFVLDDLARAKKALEVIARYDETSLWSDDRDDAAYAMLAVARVALGETEEEDG